MLVESWEPPNGRRPTGRPRTCNDTTKMRRTKSDVGRKWTTIVRERVTIKWGTICILVDSTKNCLSLRGWDRRDKVRITELRVEVIESGPVVSSENCVGGFGVESVESRCLGDPLGKFVLY